jgi:tetratricopeptide (TPR) repeat protein
MGYVDGNKPRALAAGLALFAGTVLAAWEPAGEPPAAAPPWQRLLQAEDERKAAELGKRLESLQEGGKFDEALGVARELEQLRSRVQGADHYEAADARWRVEALRRVSAKDEAVRRDYAAAASWQREADALLGKGQYPQAQPLLDKVLQARRTALGEDHPETAAASDNAAANLQRQGRYQEVEDGLRTALEVTRRTLGEQHPQTGHVYNTLAVCRLGQGHYREAEGDFQKSLDIIRRTLGEQHALTADAYNDLAAALQPQGRNGEAQEALRQALDITRKARGEDHPDTAILYNNVAYNLHEQGRYREADEVFQKALDVTRRALGERHPQTATACNNLAVNLADQGRHAEARPLYEKALAIRREVLGEQHPATATGYNNVAYNLRAQGRYREAEEVGRKALDIRLRALGGRHPDTAISYNGVALALHAQGRYKEAEEGYRKALDIRHRALGELHPLTASDYNYLAANLNAQGRYAESEDVWVRAADSFAAARLRIAASGLGRAAKTGEDSPLPALAAVLARNGKPAEAWQRFEEALGRGTWDDLSARLHRTAAEQAEQAELVAQLERIEQLLKSASAVKDPGPEQQRQRDDLLTRHLRAGDELRRFATRMEEKYGPAAGRAFEIGRIQCELPADAALLGWIDLKASGPSPADPNGEHWAFLLRRSGPPVCVRAGGSGPGGAWTEEDTALPATVRAALQAPGGDWEVLARRLRRQRLGPLDQHLGARGDLPAVSRLLVLPAPALAGVPAEVLADGLMVGYALSGTLYAHLRQQPKPTGQGLLALADPVFQAPGIGEKPRPLPPGGVLLSMVTAGGNAAKSGLKANDVLLRYAGRELKGPDDLTPLLQARGDGEPVAVTAWRDGAEIQTTLQRGDPGATLADKPAPDALREQRRLDKALASRGDGSWPPLPGTRLEAEALRGLLVGQGNVTVLTGSEASEQRLDRLARSGELGRYRFIHLATHGEVEDAWPLRSAVILARDRLPDPLAQLQAGQPAYDGRLTAQEILEHWQLHSELVTLSACQTALGKYEKGEGFVGFAQALLLAGSRSVCLSLWKVDDTATALLMQRFYANLTGRREDSKAPPGKAEALAEAKRWLRDLSADEAQRLAAALREGAARGKIEPRAPAAVRNEVRPYAHPYYWAAFVLIGDLD